LIRTFGEPDGKAIMIGLQTMAWLAACFLTYALGKAVFGRLEGMLGAVGLAVWPSAQYLTVGYLGPSAFGALMITMIAYLLVTIPHSRRYFRRSILLGMILGLAMLTLASSQVFVPIAAAATLLWLDWRRPRSWVAAGLVIIATCVVVSPWTIRNWVVFEEFIPVRTGIGLIAHQGSPTLAGTFHPGPHACTDSLGKFWTSTGPYNALNLASGDQNKEIAIYKRSFDCIEQHAPVDYSDYNEAQRDQFYLEQSKRFIEQNPWVFAKMAFFKYVVMVRGWSMEHTVVGILCLIGLLLSFRRPQPAIIALMILAYVAPYALGIPWFYRYRFPLEPLILVVAAGVVVALVRPVLARLSASKSRV
jgi:hypothetical protein